MASLISLKKVKTNVAVLSVKEWLFVKQDKDNAFFVAVNDSSVILKIPLDSPLWSFKEISPVGEYLKKKRESKRISQDTLSQLSGVSQMSISNIESGACDSINSNTLDLIINALGITPHEILTVLDDYAKQNH